MRIEKIKSRVSLVREAMHNSREQMPPNAISERSGNNAPTQHLETVMAKFDRMKPEKIRKNAVLALSFLATFSSSALSQPEDFIQTSGFTKRFKGLTELWVCKHFGGEANVLQSSMHFDELVPHCHLLVVPMHEKKLNARFFCGGDKHRMKEFQDSFYEEVGKPLGLIRGIEKEITGARHISVRDYYAAGQAWALQERARQRESHLRWQGEKDREGIEKVLDQWIVNVGIKPNVGKSIDEKAEMLARHDAARNNTAPAPDGGKWVIDMARAELESIRKADKADRKRRRDEKTM